MYDKNIVDSAKKLNKNGFNISQISKQLSVSRSTIRKWVNCEDTSLNKKRGNSFFEDLSSSEAFRQAYYYLLGQYLGDGYVSENGRSFLLRISATSKYSNISDEITNSMKLILPLNSVYIVKNTGCESISVNSNNIPFIFPQIGTGVKHLRKIELVDWQLKYLNENSKYLARGLFHSDGCYFNVSGKYNRYQFTNCSEDIHFIFQKCLELNEIAYTYCKKKVSTKNAPAWNTYIYRKKDVERAYSFLGEKS